MADISRIALGAAVIGVAGWSMMQASWLAGEQGGKPLLIAGQAVEPVRDTAGCITDGAAGWGAATTGPDVSGLQGAAGAETNAVVIPTQEVGGMLMVAQVVGRNCSADKARGNDSIATAVSALTKPERIWQLKGAAAANATLAALPAPSETAHDAFLGDDAAVTAVKKARPDAWAFTVKSARACAADYRTSGLWGSMPASCNKGTMLLSVDELGMTLWGWPNRFLARAKAAGTRVIIAEAVEDEKITGLSKPQRYSDIANSYNGYIWIDNVGEMGPALVR